MSSAPPLDNAASTFSPLLSMKVTPVRSTTHLRSRRAISVFVHVDFSSDVHGSTSRPSSVHLCSESVSAIVIRSIPMTRFFRPVAVFLRPPTGLPSQFRTLPQPLTFTNGTQFANACAYGLPTRLVQSAHRPYTLSSAGCRAHVRKRD